MSYDPRRRTSDCGLLPQRPSIRSSMHHPTAGAQERVQASGCPVSVPHRIVQRHGYSSHTESQQRSGLLASLCTWPRSPSNCAHAFFSRRLFFVALFYPATTAGLPPSGSDAWGPSASCTVEILRGAAARGPPRGHSQRHCEADLIPKTRLRPPNRFYSSRPMTAASACSRAHNGRTRLRLSKK